jgi:hypothetical protein
VGGEGSLLDSHDSWLDVHVLLWCTMNHDCRTIGVVGRLWMWHQQ